MDTKILRAVTRKEIAEEYGISPRTLVRWFKKTNVQMPSGLIDPYHLKIIYKTFGVPQKIKVV
jgi:DNA invertase Pin-like site-specific DNA recombinase